MFDKVNFVFHGSETTGYGQHAKGLWSALEPMLPQKEGGKVCHIVLGTVNDPVFYNEYDGFKIAYNVWESTEYPDDFFKRLLEFDQLWVPTTWQRDCAVKQGYPSDRVKIVPEGVDGDTFKPGKGRQDDLFRFLVFGRWEDRKYTTEIIRAFLEAFSNDHTVSLKLSVDNNFPVDEFKTTHERMAYYGLLDPRIEDLGFVSRERYIKLLQDGDVFVSCARAEGWNLPLIEALACGTVSICSNYGAQLDFAQSAIKVKIKEHRKPVNVYNMPDCPGTWAEPDYDDLVRQMRKVHEKYEFHRRKTRSASQALRDKWSWKNAAKIAFDVLDDLSLKDVPMLSKRKAEFIIHFCGHNGGNGAFLDIRGGNKQTYNVKYADADTGEVDFDFNQQPNTWSNTSIKFFRNWDITVRLNDTIVHHHRFNAENKRVMVQFDSKSMGDSIAWIPYCEEFRKKHKCKMIVSMWHKHLFEKTYPNIEFVKPGHPVGDLYAKYNIGVYFDDRVNRNPRDWRAIPLQRIASDILGLEYEEIRPIIDTSKAYSSVVKRPKKYVCLSEHSTAMCKYWHYPNGWQILVDELNRRGYNVVGVSHEYTGLKNVIKANSNHIDVTISLLLGCEMFIGLASGLAWLAWALGKPVVMISGFSAPFTEFISNNTRISGIGDCTDCLNDPLIPDRAWDEGCFHNKDYSCTRNITPDAVIDRIPYFPEENILDFTSAPILRYSRRQTSFKKFLELLHKIDDPQIVEIGTVRRKPNDPELPGDGNSTMIFAWYVKNYKGTFTACDISQESLDNCMMNMTVYHLHSDKTHLVLMDGLNFLNAWTKKIDAIYIDAYDWGPKESEKQKSIEWHLEAFKQAEYFFKSGSLIMFDDVMDATFKGKGQLAIPYALESGNYELVYQDYQVILRRK